MQLRRYLRFRLRTLLIAGTLLCIALAFVIVPARRQRQAVLELDRRGFGVTYQTEELPPLVNPWYQTWLGCDFGERVEEIRIFNSEHDTAREESNWRLIEICQPRKVSIWPMATGDRDVERAARLPSLEQLRIWNRHLTAPGLDALRQAARLEHLAILDLPLTDEDVRHLTSLRQLRILTLDGQKLTEVGLAHLAKMQNLQELTLNDSQLSWEKRLQWEARFPHCKVTWYYTPL